MQDRLNLNLPRGAHGPLQAIGTSASVLPIDLPRQLLPDLFEHAHLLDHEVDLSGLDERFHNDVTGVPTYA